MSAPDRGLTPPTVFDRLPEVDRLVPIELNPEHRQDGNGRRLASEMLGPFQKGRKLTSKVRRRDRRVAALNHDMTREVVTTGEHPRKLGRVSTNEMPLGQPVHAPKWLKRTPRLSDGQHHDVVRYLSVLGPTLPGQPWGPVRIMLSSDDVTRSERADAILRRRAYQLNSGNSPDTLQAVHYWESDADHRPVYARRDVRTAATARVRKELVRAYGNACVTCGLNHRRECA